MREFIQKHKIAIAIIGTALLPITAIVMLLVAIYGLITIFIELSTSETEE